MEKESNVKAEMAPLFKLPVDSEHKAKTFRLWSNALPHMRAFWIVTFGFFFTFWATFAPAALAPIIRDNLGFDKWQMGNAGVASVCGAIFARVFMGTFLDTLGPRYGTAFTMLIFAPAVFCIALVEDIGGFTAARLFIGCSLCMFVCCQFWVGTMFNVKIVGTVNAISAGWGNMGGGATHMVMIPIYQSIKEHVPGFEAWRWAFFVPGGVFVALGMYTLFCSLDAPDGDYRALKASGQMNKGKANFWQVMKCGFFNYRSWALLITYGYSFGVELTVDNMITTYLYDQFEMDLHTAGLLGGMFGLMNLFTRASGGMISDLVAIPWGMRGRLWALWIIQTLGGVFCIILGKVDDSLTNTIVIIIIFSIFCQQACGLHFGVAPFVSRRAYGVVSGMVGAGGNIGGAITQAIYFQGNPKAPAYTPQEGLVWMGVHTICATMLCFTLWWPMWGSMLTRGNPEYAEEDYYLQEWSAEEVAQGMHTMSMKFAMESRSQRGSKAAASKFGENLHTIAGTPTDNETDDSAHAAKAAKA